MGKNENKYEENLKHVAAAIAADGDRVIALGTTGLSGDGVVIKLNKRPAYQEQAQVYVSFQDIVDLLYNNEAELSPGFQTLLNNAIDRRAKAAHEGAEAKVVNKHNILLEANRIVNERARDTDREDPVSGFEDIAKIASAIRNKDIEPRDATAVMMAVKLSREQYAHNRDNLVDLAGYAQIDYLLAEDGYK